MGKNIRISENVEKKLRKRGEFGESWSDIIDKVLDTCPVPNPVTEEQEIEQNPEEKKLEETAANEEEVIEVNGAKKPLDKKVEDSKTDTGEEKPIEDHPEVEEIKKKFLLTNLHRLKEFEKGIEKTEFEEAKEKEELERFEEEKALEPILEEQAEKIFKLATSYSYHQAKDLAEEHGIPVCGGKQRIFARLIGKGVFS